MKKKNVNLSNKGQSLVLVALMLFALIGMLALILDGGNAYLKRRQAQTAADAGALAGVRELCLGTPALANSVAIEYAENRNYENQPDAEIDAIPTVVNANRMRVEANVTYDTFFASIFNIDRPTVWAIAEAACFSATYGEGVLPVVWSCREPVDGWPGDSSSCQQQRISESELDTYLLTPDVIQPELYVVMDSESLNSDLNCKEDYPDDPNLGEIWCDFDGDNESDWLAGGSRSWVDLDGDQSGDDCPGGSGSGELVDWILNGYDCEINQHTWIPTKTGNMGNVFEAAYCRWIPESETYAPCPDHHGLDKPLVIIPVNDDFCSDGDPRVFCNDRVHSDPLDLVYLGSGNQPHYHLKTFVAFYITCVRLSVNKPEGSCPGIERAKELNPGVFLGMGYKSIEGYFLEGEFSGIGGRGDPNIDTGLVTIFLDR